MKRQSIREVKVVDREYARRFKASRRTYMVFLIMTSPCSLFGIYSPFSRASNGLQAGAFCISLTALVFLWLYTFEIVLTHEGISHRSLFGGRRFLKWQEIKKYEFPTGWERFEDRWKPPFRIEITPLPSSGKKGIMINLRVFAWEHVQDLTRTLEEHVPQHSGKLIKSIVGEFMSQRRDAKRQSSPDEHQ